MMVLNKVSRYDVARNALQASRENNPKVDAVADRLIQELDKQVADFWVYIKANGKGQKFRCISILFPNAFLVDPDGVFDRPEEI